MRLNFQSYGKEDFDCYHAKKLVYWLNNNIFCAWLDNSHILVSNFCMYRDVKFIGSKESALRIISSLVLL